MRFFESKNVSVLEKKVSARIPLPKLDLGFGSWYRILVSVAPYTQDGDLAEDTAINCDNEDKSWKKSRKDWIKNHSSEVQCYKCAAIVLKDEIEEHLIQVHDCHIKQDFGPIRQHKCELCGRAYIKVIY